MARLRYYLQSVASGYASMGASILCTLVSVPLALSYLSEREFGLWALATQIGFYIALVDFGMTGALSRILVDYKDRRDSIEFSSVVRTSSERATCTRYKSRNTCWVAFFTSR